jgi:ribosomal protein S27AE
MGKSKKVRKADVTALREYVRIRNIVKNIVVVLAVLCIAACIFVGPTYPKNVWIIIVLFALYILMFIILRLVSRCPYCGKSVMGKFNRRTHCPYCHRPIKPNAPATDAMAGKR